MTSHSPPRIGVLVDGISEGYSRSILRGAFEAAAGRDLGILLVPGGRLESNPEQSLTGANVAYLLPGRENVCGIVLLAGALLGERKPYDLNALRRSFASIPVVSIGLELPEVPAIGVDDAAAMSEVAQHVARAGARRIAFIAGPDGSQESAARFAGYKRGLESAGLDADLTLVRSGDFSEPSGRRAALDLLDSGR
jgi:DNA-binding LacI/PurR family transcriptional regulator